jgi:DNA-binding NarL/FixJ family response regulator
MRPPVASRWICCVRLYSGRATVRTTRHLLRREEQQPVNPMVEERQIRVLIADGRKILREGLVLLLEKYPDIQIIGDAADVEAAIRLARALSAQVVVLHASLAWRSAESVRALLRVQPNARVVVVLNHPSRTAVHELLTAGARGCLGRDSATEELVTAIRMVMTGKHFVSPQIAGRVVSAPARVRGRGAGNRELAPREREILRHIAEGRTTKEIAARLGIGVKTVETHRRRMMEKLNLHSIAELTKYAVLEGLTTLEVPA